MKKLVIVVTHLGYGGIQQYVSSLCKILEDDYEVSVVSVFKKNKNLDLGKKVKVKYLCNYCSSKKEWLESLRVFDVITFFKESINNFKALLFKSVNLKRYLKHLDADIIITTRLFDTKMVNKILANKKIVKIMSEHNTPNDKMKKQVIKNTSNFDYVVFNSKLIYDVYKPYLKDKARLINPAVDFNFKNKSKLDTNNLIAVGRFEKEKGFSDLLKVIKIVKNKIKDVHLTLVGDGTLFTELKDEIKENKLEKYVTLTGFLDKEEINKLYSKSSLYLMTSYEESLGLVMLEAISKNVPIVAFENMGTNLILKDGNGIIIKNRNIKKMADKIIKLLESKLELKKLLNNKEILNEYSFKSVKSNWISFLKEAKPKKKILFMANSGGHLTELLKLEKLIINNNSLLVTEKVDSTLNLKDKYNVYYFNYGTRSHMFSFIFKFLGNCFKSVYVLFKFKPKFLITTGTHIAGPMCILAHLTKTKVIYIETMANINTKSATGKLAYPFTDLFIVQWEDMLKVYPKEKTVYYGRIV